MAFTSEKHSKSDLLGHAAGSLTRIGVVGNDADYRFGIEDLTDEPADLESQLRTAGYSGGPVAIEGPLGLDHDLRTLIYDKDRFPTREDATAAWDPEYRRSWRERVEQRVDDWLCRLQDMRDQIDTWLRADDFAELTVYDLPSTPMHEDLMRKFGVGPREMPAFEIRSGEKRIMRFLPKGLWIIGANGRVDLVTRVSAPILVDQSEPLSGVSDWQLYDPRDKARSVPFDEKAFRDLVISAMK